MDAYENSLLNYPRKIIPDSYTCASRCCCSFAVAVWLPYTAAITFTFCCVHSLTQSSDDAMKDEGLQLKMASLGKKVSNLSLTYSLSLHYQQTLPGLENPKAAQVDQSQCCSICTAYLAPTEAKPGDTTDSLYCKHHYILTQKYKLALRLKIDGVGGVFSLEKATSMRDHIVKKIFFKNAIQKLTNLKIKLYK